MFRYDILYQKIERFKEKERFLIGGIERFFKKNEAENIY
jgi:hypothetical protein